MYGSHRGPHPAIPQAPESDSEALLQSKYAHPGAAQADENQRALRTAVLSASRKEPAARRSRRAVLRTGAQPRAGADAGRHRESKPQDAARIVVEPDGFRRAPRSSAGNRRPVPAGHRAVARAATRLEPRPPQDGSTASAATSGATTAPRAGARRGTAQRAGRCQCRTRSGE